MAGLSKFQDVVNILSRRPQLQERLASELADAIMNDLSAHGVFVRITSTQLCMLIKGTMQQDSKVITLESRGVLAETGTVRDECLNVEIIHGMMAKAYLCVIVPLSWVY